MSPPTDPRTVLRLGRIVDRRTAVIGGIVMGLLLIVLAGAVVVGGPGNTPSSPPPDEDVHVEVDPLTDQPVVNSCADVPEMCGEGVGAGTGPCADTDMCGQVIPDGDSEEIDAGSGACAGELCGDIGPGIEDESGP